MKKKFSPRHHLVRFSSFLLRSLVSPSILYLVAAGNIFLLAGATLFFHFEKGENQLVHSFFDALWWAFATVTTVGYGDIFPVTTMGRIVGILLMLSGSVIFFGFTAILISAFSALTTEEFLETEQLTKREYTDVIKRLTILTAQVQVLDNKIDSLSEHYNKKDAKPKDKQDL